MSPIRSPFFPPTIPPGCARPVHDARSTADSASGNMAAPSDSAAATASDIGHTHSRVPAIGARLEVEPPARLPGRAHFAMLFLLAGCVPIYAPAALTVPVLDRPGQLDVSAAVGSGGGLVGGYAVTDHLGVLGGGTGYDGAPGAGRSAWSWWWRADGGVAWSGRTVNPSIPARGLNFGAAVLAGGGHVSADVNFVPGPPLFCFSSDGCEPSISDRVAVTYDADLAMARAEGWFGPHWKYLRLLAVVGVTAEEQWVTPGASVGFPTAQVLAPDLGVQGRIGSRRIGLAFALGATPHWVWTPGATASEQSLLDYLGYVPMTCSIGVDVRLGPAGAEPAPPPPDP